MWLYKRSSDESNRFVLGVSGDHPLVTIGINPSTATPEKLDNTIRIVQRYSKDLGYDSWIMINVYPQRTTDPIGLHIYLSEQIHQENLKEIDLLFKERELDIWSAWGTTIKSRKYLYRCLLEVYHIIGGRGNWFSIGQRSKEGHPHHPLYLRRNLPLEKFDIESYTNNCEQLYNRSNCEHYWKQPVSIN